MVRIVFITVFIITTCVMAKEKSPDFNDYRVEKNYRGSWVAPKISKIDIYYRNYIIAASNQDVNFSNHYVVSTIECGTECIRGFIFDAENGNITWFPFYIASTNSDYFEPLDFKIDSSLIMFRGSPDEERPNGEYYYNFKDGKFIPVAVIPLPNDYVGEQTP